MPGIFWISRMVGCRVYADNSQLVYDFLAGLRDSWMGLDSWWDQAIRERCGIATGSDNNVPCTCLWETSQVCLYKSHMYFVPGRPIPASSPEHISVSQASPQALSSNTSCLVLRILAYAPQVFSIISTWGKLLFNCSAFNSLGWA